MDRHLQRSRRAAAGLTAGVSLLALSAGAAFAQPTSDQSTQSPTTNTPTTSVPASGNPVNEQEQKATATPTGGGDEVVITGFRSSLRNAIQTKRSSEQIVESISAEDIGKLPDNSIAESIARLPGLTAQRLDGRDSVISIRGLSPDFSTTLLNGREQVSTGDNRAAEFDQYPSELIQGVVVYKTPEAGLVGEGIAGTVDLRTIRPLDYKKRIVSFNARGELDTLSGRTDNGYRVSGTYVDQFANDTIGISIGVANEQSPNVSNRYRVWGYPTTGGGALLPGGFFTAAYYGELERTGVSFTGQWRPNSHYNSTVDFYYSDYFNTQDYHGMEGALGYGANLVSTGPVTNGVVSTGVYNNYRFVGRNDLNSRQADLYSVGWNNVYEDGRWKFIGDASFSGVRRRDRVLETYSGTGRSDAPGATDTITFFNNGNGDLRFNDALNRGTTSGILLTSPQGWGGDVVPGGQDGYLNAPLVRDQLQAYRASALYTLDRFGVHGIEVGGNYTQRFKSYSPDEYFLGLNADLADPNHATSVPFPASVLSSNASVPFVTGTTFLNADPSALISVPGLYSFLRNPNADVATKGWKVKEDVGTFWLKATIDQPMLGGALTGNAGIQVVYTDQSSTGSAASGAPIILRKVITDGATYTEPLPSVNLNFRLPDSGDVIRFAVARTLARARMDQLNASINFSYNAANNNQTNLAMSPYGGGGGNPRLRPWIADGVDLSFEHYLGRDAYVSVAGYYKYLETYIYNQSVLYDFSTYPIPAGQNPLLKTGFVNTPQNGDGGNLYGVELTAVMGASSLIPWLSSHTGMDWAWIDGFGVSASGSYTYSSINPSGPGSPPGPLPGLSRYVSNGTVYYEKNGFSARISARYRSKYLAEVSGFGDTRQTTSSDEETIVDAQVGYAWTSGPLKGLGVLLQGNNLTNEPFRTYYNGDPRQTELFQEYGRRILFGVSYKY